MSSPLVSIGAVVRAHGVRGTLRIRPFDVESEALGKARRIILGGKPREVEHAARERGEWLVKLRGIDDRDLAESLKGSLVELPRDELPRLDDREVYVTDLVGCTLVDTTGATLGVVRDVRNYGAQELLVIEGPRGESLVPFVEPIVTAVDMEARRIVCDPPEGLFDLDGGPKVDSEDEGGERESP